MRSETTKFEIRPATEADCDFLWRVTAITMREYIAAIWGWDETQQEKRFWCTFVPGRWLVVMVDGRDAGGFAVDHHPQAVYLADIQLLPDFQRRGIGSAVIQALTAEAKSLGVPLALQVLDSNPDARRLYERLGFSYVCPSPTPHHSIMRKPCG